MSNLPGAYDYHVKAGNDWSDAIVWKINGVGVDVTGYTVTLRLKTLTGVTSYPCTGTDAGDISWTVPRTVVDANVGFSTYDICAYSGDGTPNWLLAGTLEVTA